MKLKDSTRRQMKIENETKTLPLLSLPEFHYLFASILIFLQLLKSKRKTQPSHIRELLFDQPFPKVLTEDYISGERLVWQRWSVIFCR